MSIPRPVSSRSPAGQLRRPFVSLIVVAALLPGVGAHAQSGNLAGLAPAAVAEGPTVVHDTVFNSAVTEVRSIDVPFTTLSLLVLNVRNMPHVGRNRVFGAHAHTRPCAVDAAASGPHHANPAGDVNKTLAAREVWLDVRIDALGRGTALALFDWRIRKGDAGSVVIHAEPTNSVTGVAGARILCTTIPLGS